LLIKNQEATLLIDNTGINGEGIGRFEDITVFVPYALTGEKVRAKILLVKKNYAVAKLIEVLTPAEERDRPKCPVFCRCGGCQLQHIRYGNQLKIKTNIVSDCFKKIAGLNPEVAPCIKSSFKYNYRNKLALPVADSNGLIFTGFFGANSHNIVPIDDCPLHPDWAEKIIASLKDFMWACKIKGYNERNHSGIIRHVIARELNGQIMITLVINADELNCMYFIKALKKIFPSFGLYLNINKEITNVITGDKYIHVFGSTVLKDEYNGIKYTVGPDSFMQVNNSIKDKLYYKVLDYVKEFPDSTVIDAYSGTGLLAAQMAKFCDKVYTIEISKEAHAAAEQLISANNIGDKMENIQGDCALHLPKLLAKLEKKNTVLLLDPPRKGVDKDIIKAVIKHKPKSILYISCNPATLARDIGYICGTLDIDKESTSPHAENFNNLYQITSVQPFDMFPQTKHVECLVLMSRTND
jgi:23S rRNA (uracil1939-C5)-methyltransferase